MGYKTVGMPDVVDPKEGPVEGFYMGKKEDVGPNHSTTHQIKLLDGSKTVSVWGTTQLDGRLEMVPVGSQIKISYKGRVESQQRKGASYHNFEVELWEDDGSADGAAEKGKGNSSEEEDDLPF